ncbi:MAG: SUMF1/EgtB/PvdO family nonheme iron enzyme [Planctomycetes bacterium]|nr:SUMF1/EgtB/PvdO family nonheme iron enzyme [Planctomycetota bacterium]
MSEKKRLAGLREVPKPRLALLIGIGTYGNPAWPDLDAPPTDVAALAEILADDQRGAWKLYAPIDMVPTDAAGLTTLVENFFEGKGSRLLYYSGHGLANKRGVWLVTPDGRPGAEGVSLGDLLRVAAQSRVEDVLLLLDCCYGGAATPIADQAFRGTAARPSGAADGAPVCSVLAASSPADLAWEKGGHGVFTRELLQGLARAGDDEGCVRIGALCDDLRDRLSRTGWPQPWFGSSASDRELIVAWTKERNRSAAGPAPFRGETERVYLRALLAARRLLPLADLGTTADPIHIPLQAVYVPLCSRAPAQLDPRRKKRAKPSPETTAPPKRIPLQRLLLSSPRLAVIGPPGSGKSTLLTYIALVLAEARLNPGSGVPAKELGLTGDEAGLPAPVLLTARDLAYAMPAASARPPAFVELLAACLQRGKSRPIDPASLEERLKEGSLLLLVDGLDEVADEGLRQRIMELLGEVAVDPEFQPTGMLLTCRPRAFERLTGWQGFEIRHVDDFDDDEIRSFLARWSERLPLSGDKAAYAADLSGRILQSPQLRAMASNPLMLTMIGVVHYGEGQLPEDREKLYELCCKYLLNRRHQGKEVDAVRPGVCLRPGNRWAVCEALAWKLMTNEQSTATVSRAEARDVVRSCVNWEGMGVKPDDALLDETLDWFEERSGLLASDKHSSWSFRHRTFQEFFSAKRLAGLDSEECWPVLWRALSSSSASSANWHEVYLLLVRLLSEGQREGLLRRILKAAEKKEVREEEAVSLIERALAELDRTALDGSLRRSIEKLTQSVIGVLADPEQTVDLRTRIEVAEALGRFGDPRLGKGPMDIAWVDVPAGKFRMGSDKREVERVWKTVAPGSGAKKRWFTAESPEHPVDLPAFRIGRFPVTNAQYAAFVDATGRRPPEVEAAIGDYQPWEGGHPPVDRSTHPVVGVSWVDAGAYCAWLSTLVRAEVRLPTEAEWEKAARGTDARRYPWGDELKISLTNSGAGAGHAGTTPVGVFPGGASPYGALDMAGNVWEWCSSLYKPYPYDREDGREDIAAGGARVLRGGSWNFVQTRVRAAYRGRGDPGFRDEFVGFRVVVGAGVWNSAI